jgi:hypothetical protein
VKAWRSDDSSPLGPNIDRSPSDLGQILRDPLIGFEEVMDPSSSGLNCRSPWKLAIRRDQVVEILDPFFSVDVEDPKAFAPKTD